MNASARAGECNPIKPGELPAPWTYARDVFEAAGLRATSGEADASERASASVVVGAEVAELGAGGVAVVALAAGVAPDTVRRGRAEAQGLDAASVVSSPAVQPREYLFFWYS